MRISADPKSPFFSSAALGATVYLNGEPLRMCVTADDTAGTAERYAADENGHIRYDGENCELVTLRGRVSIVIPGMCFGAWMRQRTDRAHAAFMAGHATGGIAYT